MQPPSVYCVRAQHGDFADRFASDGFVAIGWLDYDDLSGVKDRAGIEALYRKAYPEDTSIKVISQQVGQISRFLFEIKAGDYVITPCKYSDFLLVGRVLDAPYFHEKSKDNCIFYHRRKTEWLKAKVPRSALSIPMQYSLRASLTVFRIGEVGNFFEVIGRPELSPAIAHEVDPKKAALKLLLERLNDRDFELLVTELLRCLGFQETEHTGGTGDGGVDVKGVLTIPNIASIRLFVQAKRLDVSARVPAKDVLKLRQSIPKDAQGAFFTTASFEKTCRAAAEDREFPRIGLVDGVALIDLLQEHMGKLTAERQEVLRGIFI